MAEGANRADFSFIYISWSFHFSSFLPFLFIIFISLFINSFATVDVGPATLQFLICHLLFCLMLQSHWCHAKWNGYPLVTACRPRESTTPSLEVAAIYMRQLSTLKEWINLALLHKQTGTLDVDGAVIASVNKVRGFELTAEACPKPFSRLYGAHDTAERPEKSSKTTKQYMSHLKAIFFPFVLFV